MPEPTTDAARRPVPINSAKKTLGLIYLTPTMSTTKTKVSFAPIGPEPLAP